LQRNAADGLFTRPSKFLLLDRIRQAGRFFRVVPFSITDQEKFIKGKIDLFFEERNGWVIMDYKTDGVQGKGLKKRVESYREQNNTYGP
jgi:ATP-dependent exoDNAse (exonuclease V) beta subunit